jgi:hypothetical protein
MQTRVDGVDQPQFAGQEMEGTDATTVDGMRAIRDLILDVAGTEHGLGADNRFLGFIQPPLDATLAILEPTRENAFHLKSSVGDGAREAGYFLKHLKTPRISSFFQKSPKTAPNPSLV